MKINTKFKLSALISGGTATSSSRTEYSIGVKGKPFISIAYGNVTARLGRGAAEKLLKQLDEFGSDIASGGKTIRMILRQALNKKRG